MVDTFLIDTQYQININKRQREVTKTKKTVFNTSDVE